MNLPIGTPVTATWADGSKSNGTIVERKQFYGWASHLKDWFCVRISRVSVYTFPEHHIKIRYDSPAPFTLWQYNSLLGRPANDSWSVSGHPEAFEFSLGHTAIHSTFRSRL